MNEPDDTMWYNLRRLTLVRASNRFAVCKETQSEIVPFETICNFVGECGQFICQCLATCVPIDKGSPRPLVLVSLVELSS